MDRDADHPDPAAVGSRQVSGRTVRIVTRDAWARDIAPMLEVVREIDRAEWAAAGGTPMSAYLGLYVHAAVEDPVRNVCKITLADDQPMMMWGVVPHLDDAESTACGWMIAAQGAYAIQRRLHKETLHWLRGVYEITGYQRIVCYVWERNTDHHRWVEWLGFKAVAVTTSGPFNQQFTTYERMA